MAGRRLALLIATSSYDDAAFGRLRAPVADIEALRNVLADPGIGDYEVDLLSNAASHEVNQAVEGFFAEAKLDDLVLLYFSGHGFKSEAGRLYLITRESRQRRLNSTAVSAQFVRDQLDRCRSRRKVVILDCCYAGAFPPGATKGADHVDVLGGLGGRGCAVITASSALEYAFEEDGNSSQVSQTEPSVFTGALIDGLATGEADINGDGLIDIDELYDHVYKRVKDRVNQQTPGRDSQLEGTLYVAASPRGPQPVPLPLEFREAIKSPFMRLRLGVVGELLELCEGTHPGKLMAVKNALSELAEDDSAKVSKAAKSALEAVSERLAGVAREESRVRADALDTHSLTEAARSEAAKIISDARREAEQLLSAAGLEVARLRIEAERDNTAMMEAAKKERDKLLSNARSAAERMRADAQKVHAATHGLLKGSEARIAEAEAELERRLAARREELERKENEQLAALVRLEANARKNAEQEGAFVHQAMVEAEEMLSLICDLHPELADGMLTERLKEIRARTENYRRDLISVGTANHDENSPGLPFPALRSSTVVCPDCGIKVLPEDLICFRCGANLPNPSPTYPPGLSHFPAPA